MVSRCPSEVYYGPSRSSPVNALDVLAPGYDGILWNDLLLLGAYGASSARLLMARVSAKAVGTKTSQNGQVLHPIFSVELRERSEII